MSERRLTRCIGGRSGNFCVSVGFPGRFFSWYRHSIPVLRALSGGTGTHPSFFPVKSGVRQGCVLAPYLFSVCMDWLLGRRVGSGLWGASFGEERFTDLDFADDAVIFAMNMQSLFESLAALSQDSERLRLIVPVFMHHAKLSKLRGSQ